MARGPGHPYPLVACSKHPDRLEPGYAVCVHVRAGAAVDWFYEAEADAIGEALCKDCHGSPSISHEDLLLVCRSCLHGYLAPNSVVAALIDPGAKS